MPTRRHYELVWLGTFGKGALTVEQERAKGEGKKKRKENPNSGLVCVTVGGRRTRGRRASAAGRGPHGWHTQVASGGAADQRSFGAAPRHG